MLHPAWSKAEEVCLHVAGVIDLNFQVVGLTLGFGLSGSGISSSGCRDLVDSLEKRHEISVRIDSRNKEVYSDRAKRAKHNTQRHPNPKIQLGPMHNLSHVRELP